MLGQGRVLHYPFQLGVSFGFLLFAAAASQMPLGSRLSVAENNYWVSSSGKFAIGFFNHSDQYSVGIHFNSNSIPLDKQTVVWVAGGDLAVGEKSYFQLREDGELVLFDSTRGVVAWASNTSDLSVAEAVLLDNGNLVLLNKKRDIVWQSFDDPSDALLPGQNFSASHILRAASRNSLSSYYSLFMDDTGQLRLWWERSFSYWISGSPSKSIVRAMLDTNGSLQLLDQRSRSVWSIFAQDHNDSNVKFRFLRLDVDGNLRLYSWVDASRSWRTVWQAVEDQCNVFATCGFCGICVFNASGFPICRCPFVATTESSLKCLVPYGGGCKSGSFMTTYEHTLLYGIYYSNETIVQTSLQQCKSLCENDMLCTAATFINNGTAQCRILKTQYVSGKSVPSLSSISFVKRCLDPIAVKPIVPMPSLTSPANTSREQPNKLCVPCLVGMALGTFIVFVFVQVGVGFCIWKRKNRTIRKQAHLARLGASSKGLIIFSYCEIKDLTQNFKLQIGPKMFKGLLPNNRPVVVKDLKFAVDERKFRSTASRIGNMHHKNLLRLEGYCCELDQRFLVYEHAKNGSLRNCIEDPKIRRRITWRKKMEICLAVARAISYLRSGCREFVAHGNLKCENVVLSENFEAKVSEYGLGNLSGDPLEVNPAPDTDIKDFGKLLLTLLCGHPEGDDFCIWAYERLACGQVDEIVDARIEGINPEELERSLRIAFWCLQVDEQMRPSMGEVAKVLEGTLTVDPPPPPFVCRISPDEPQSSGSESEP